MIITKICQLRPLVSVAPFYSFALTKEAVPRRFRNRQKDRPEIFSIQDKSIIYNPVQAIHLMRLHSFASFLESV